MTIRKSSSREFINGARVDWRVVENSHVHQSQGVPTETSETSMVG